LLLVLIGGGWVLAILFDSATFQTMETRKNLLHGKTSDYKQIEIQEEVKLKRFELQINVEKKYSSARTLSRAACVFAVLSWVGCLCAFFQAQGSTHPEELVTLRMFAVVPLLLAFLCWILFLYTSQSMPYRWPSLFVDEDGILALYGGKQVAMQWDTVKYFVCYRAKERHAIYEISDGVQFLRWRDPGRQIWFDSGYEPALHVEKLFAQLPGYVVEKTGLPLLESVIYRREITGRPLQTVRYW
jgi:hypothetical protein